MKAKRVNSMDGSLYGYRIICPGCSDAHGSLYYHVLPVGDHGDNPKRDGWTFNGDIDKPVFSPSLLVDKDAKPADYPRRVRCHTFIGCNGAQPGQIIFLDDCTHRLRGAVELPDINGDWN